MTRLIVFVKAPRPGAVKTRLAGALGAEEACRIYCRMVEALLREIEPLTEVELRFTPDEAAGEIKPWARPQWVLAPQGTGDLGCRLISAFDVAFRSGVERVALIGSDCPEVRRSDIADAWSALGSHDVVLGPAKDGGYWLIGLRAPQPDLFVHMPWSTTRVFQETLERCRVGRRTVAVLRELADIDTEADWQRFVADTSKIRT